MFLVNLSQAYETAIYESEYDHLPSHRNFSTLRLSSERLLIRSVATCAPDMDGLRRQFRSTESTQRGPYFRGYCGEHVSEHCGIVQLAGFSSAEGNLLICNEILLFTN